MTSQAAEAPTPCYSTPNWLTLALVCWILYLSFRLRSVSRSAMPPTSDQSSTLRVGTFNIRYDGAPPVLLPPTRPPPARPNPAGEQPWCERRWLVADSVLWSNLDVVGLQEVLQHQVGDLKALLGEEWGWVGVGRDDGKQAGEYAPIFYRRDRLHLLTHRYFWLSLHPGTPGSKDWDAGQPRMVTLAEFAYPPSHPAEGEENHSFFILNTHWDDRGPLSRTKAAEIILEQVRLRGLGTEGKLVVLLGDLNSPMEEEGYRTLTGWRYAQEKPWGEKRLSFGDARLGLAVAEVGARGEGGPLLHGPFGEHDTFTGFAPSDEAKIIDFVLYLDNGSVSGAHDGGRVRRSHWRVSRYGVMPNRFEGGILASDHRLVVGAFERV